MVAELAAAGLDRPGGHTVSQLSKPTTFEVHHLRASPLPWVAVPGLLGLTLVLLFLSAWKIRRMEILDTED